MKKLSFFLIALMMLGLVSCKKEAPDAGQLAAVAAKGYYDLLQQGKLEEYVNGFHMPNRISDAYHKQLLLNAQMFVEQQKEEHKGMKGVEILSAKADTALHVADVFLQMVYGDSTKEQVVVPMVEVGGTWKMR